MIPTDIAIYNNKYEFNISQLSLYKYEFNIFQLSLFEWFTSLFSKALFFKPPSNSVEGFANKEVVEAQWSLHS